MEIKFLKGPSDAEVLRRLYETVLEPSFPASEREPEASLFRVLNADDLRGAVAVTPGGEPVGALFLEWFDDVRAGLLCYFAVRQDLRGRGVGRALVAAATPRWRAELRPRVLFAEAEDPRFHPASAQYGDGAARLRLYSGYRARRLPIEYLVPELMPGAGRLPNLLLLVAEADDSVLAAPDRIRGEVVADFLAGYYARTEGRPVRDDDEQLQALLAQCRNPDGLRLLDLADTRP